MIAGCGFLRIPATSNTVAPRNREGSKPCSTEPRHGGCAHGGAFGSEALPNFGQNGGIPQGNFNYDTTVNTLDFDVLAVHFGVKLQPAPANPADAPIAAAPSAARTLFANAPISDATFAQWLDDQTADA
jgi:hypothetical protein